MNKYRNTRTESGGEKYASKREATRHAGLLLMEKAGMITGLTREVPFILAPAVKIEGETRARPAMKYRADFVYCDVKTGRIVVEDAKGMQTPVYRAKKHLMATVHGIHIREV